MFRCIGSTVYNIPYLCHLSSYKIEIAPSVIPLLHNNFGLLSKILKRSKAVKPWNKGCIQKETENRRRGTKK
uniref:Uncharacterized protein n=1 Tax=Rhizophora mucronata TaxID=61149 RepID=A0A2P2NI70_RHIMU